MYVESAKSTGCLSKGCIEKYPKGVAHVTWNNLHRNYSKTDILLVSKLRQKLHRLILKGECDTTKLFGMIATIQIQARKINDDTI